MDEAQIQKIIQLLEAVRQRPGMFLYSGYAQTFNWIVGFNLGLRVAGWDDDENFSDSYKETITERGWEWSATLPLQGVQHSGLSDEEITRELLTIWIEAWKKDLEKIRRDE